MGEVERGGRKDEGLEGTDSKAVVAGPVEALRREVSQEVSWGVSTTNLLGRLMKDDEGKNPILY